MSEGDAIMLVSGKRDQSVVGSSFMGSGLGSTPKDHTMEVCQIESRPCAD